MYVLCVVCVCMYMYICGWVCLRFSPDSPSPLHTRAPLLILALVQPAGPEPEPMEPTPAPKAQSSRVSAGLGPIMMIGSLVAITRPLLKNPARFLDSLICINQDGCIPSVMEMGELTLRTAQDQKTYGQLKDDPLDVEDIAFIMKYSAEDTIPPLYKELNDRCYNPDRSLFRPFAPFVVSTVLAMKQIEPWDGTTVFRGVKADLREDYKAGREFTCM